MQFRIALVKAITIASRIYKISFSRGSSFSRFSFSRRSSFSRNSFSMGSLFSMGSSFSRSSFSRGRRFRGVFGPRSSLSSHPFVTLHFL